jgi:hypothetical protein
MKRSENSGKFILQNELRTWSALKRKAAENGASTPTATSSRPNPISAGQVAQSPIIPVRRWGGCVNGCNHDKMNWPKRPMRKNTFDFLGHKDQQLPPAVAALAPLDSEKEDHPVAAQEASVPPIIEEPTPAKLSRKHSIKAIHPVEMPISPGDASNDASNSEEEEDVESTHRGHQPPVSRIAPLAKHLQPPQRTPGDGFSDDSDYFPGMRHLNTTHRSKLRASSKQRQQSKERKLARRQTEQNWTEESGMGHGSKAERLGDNDGEGTSDDATLAKSQSNTGKVSMDGPILREALRGDMIVENSEEERAQSAEEANMEKTIGTAEVDELQDAERKDFGEVY